jgi:hypothetical protein
MLSTISVSIQLLILMDDLTIKYTVCSGRKIHEHRIYLI